MGYVSELFYFENAKSVKSEDRVVHCKDLLHNWLDQHLASQNPHLSRDERLPKSVPDSF